MNYWVYVVYLLMDFYYILFHVWIYMISICHPIQYPVSIIIIVKINYYICIRFVWTVNWVVPITWWRHQMETFSALLAICAGNSPVPGEFPTQRPVTRSFDVFFDPRLNKRLSKRWWGWWFETISCPLWRHRDDSLWCPWYKSRSKWYLIRSIPEAQTFATSSLRSMKPSSHDFSKMEKYPWSRSWTAYKCRQLTLISCLAFPENFMKFLSYVLP